MPLVTACLTALLLVPQDSTPAPKPDPAAAAAAPKAAVARRGSLRATLQRPGRLVPVEPVEVKVELEVYTGELKILEVAAHGSPINAGDILLRLSTEKLDEQVARGEFDLAQAERKAAIADEQAGLAEAAARDELQRSESELEWARRRLQGYLEHELAFDQEQERLGKQATQNGLEDQQDELGQLEKMYKEDELVDATEEIVLKRSRRGFAQSQAWAKLAERRQQYQLEYPKAMERQRLELETQLKVKAAERVGRAQELARTERELSLQRTRFELERQQRDLGKLRADRDRLTVRASRAGLVLHGEPDAAPTNKTLAVGGRVGPGAVLMTIADPDRLEIRTEIPETHLFRATSGKAASAKLAAIPDRELTGSIRVDPLPTSREADKNLYRAVVAIAKPDPRHRPGLGCEVTIVLDAVQDAVLAPLAAISERDGVRFARVAKAEAGPFEERRVVVGPDDGRDVVIEQGVEAGEFVALPEAKQPEAKT